MANNSIVKFLTSAKAIVGIIVVVVGLIFWFFSVNGRSIANTIELGEVKTELSKDDIAEIGMLITQAEIKKDVERIGGKVDEIQIEQRSMDVKLDRIFEKVK